MFLQIPNLRINKFFTKSFLFSFITKWHFAVPLKENKTFFVKNKSWIRGFVDSEFVKICHEQIIFSEILIYDFILTLAPLCTTVIIFLPRQQKSVHKKFLKILRTKLGAISSPMAWKVREIYHIQDQKGFQSDRLHEE